MGYAHCKPYRGHYCGQFLRSFNEFIVAVHLEVVQKKIWKTESIVIEDSEGKRKIPDFIVYDNNGKIIQLIEVKNTDQEAEDVLVDYVNRRISLDYVDHKFLGMTSTRKRLWIKKIIDVIGKDAWNSIAKEYKLQSGTTNAGFVGAANPMFGKKHSVETRKKLSAKAGHFGSDNGMFGKTHTKEAKMKIGKKWNDPERKANLVKKGFIKHFSALSQPDKENVTKYFVNRFAGIKSVKPAALNNFYSMSKEKAVDLFGNEEMFFAMLKGLTTK